MIWFLRLFAQFRWIEVTNANLQDALTEVRSEADSLRQRLEASEQDRNELWALVQQSLDAERAAYANERAAYQMHVNHVIQRSGGGVPYPEAHSLPNNAVPNLDAETGPAGRQSRMLPSEAVRLASQRVVAQFIASKKAKTG